MVYRKRINRHVSIQVAYNSTSELRTSSGFAKIRHLLESSFLEKVCQKPEQ